MNEDKKKINFSMTTGYCKSASAFHGQGNQALKKGCIKGNVPQQTIMPMNQTGFPRNMRALVHRLYGKRTL